MKRELWALAFWSSSLRAFIWFFWMKKSFRGRKKATQQQNETRFERNEALASSCVVIS